MPPDLDDTTASGVEPRAPTDPAMPTSIRVRYVDGRLDLLDLLDLLSLFDGWNLTLEVATESSDQESCGPSCWTSWTNCTASIRQNSGKTARRISCDTRSTICTVILSTPTTDGCTVCQLGLLDSADRPRGSATRASAGSGERARLAATRRVGQPVESPLVESIPQIDAQFQADSERHAARTACNLRTLRMRRACLLLSWIAASKVHLTTAIS